MAAKDRRRCASVAAASGSAAPGVEGATVTSGLPFGPYHHVMDTTRSQNAHTALMSLEATAVSARAGFACMFSSSDEYESALIAERRAQGRYHQSRNYWPIVMFAGASLAVAGSVLLLN